MSSWILSNPIVYPALEVIHIVGIALLVGNLVLLEARVWGMGRELPVAALAKLSLTLSLIGFGLAVFSGALMFASQAAELIANPAFVLKMGFLTLAGANAGLFHARDGLAKLDRVARAQTALSLGLWLAVIICGRWIAYR
ncbi:MAG: hypothetical protein H7Y61_04525 [Rhizobiales bacterium]|nr:hypothetical protein [Rhizobacter sp.]